MEGGGNGAQAAMTAWGGATSPREGVQAATRQQPRSKPRLTRTREAVDERGGLLLGLRLDAAPLGLQGVRVGGEG